VIDSIFNIKILDLMLPSIALLGILTLIGPSATISATFLFLQSVLISICFALNSDLSFAILIRTILISLLLLMLICGHYYLEFSCKKSMERISKVKMLIGPLLLLFAWKIAENLTVDQDFFLNTISIKQEDALFLIIAGFSFFSMLVSSAIIFDMNNFKTGE